MVSTFTPKSNITTLPELALNSIIVVQPGIHYTCPAGKKAIFTGYVICIALGGSTSGSLRDPTNLFDLCTWNLTGSTVPSALDTTILIGFRFPVTMELDAGNTIRTIQNNGFMNAEFHVVGKVLELPA